ncbi:MAG: hypothetical protein AYP45_10710 [Candidatus Brocadia carolinensis]|uniref:Uncharacterized protein n=1 Tax=Candidatus Brocadia carolinensis TaxID=1004156 RepID=A0A1V4ASN8_9BACT|nr:MAG: hypothetical protein AYP45_10710 [Candidatus Brocadia caroliniensis]
MKKRVGILWTSQFPECACPQVVSLQQNPMAEKRIAGFLCKNLLQYFKILLNFIQKFVSLINHKFNYLILCFFTYFRGANQL